MAAAQQPGALTPFQDRQRIWNNDIDWLLNSAPAALGLRGTTGSVIAAIERGGGASGSDHEHVTDEQLGWGSRYVNRLPGDVERYRSLVAIWRRCDQSTHWTLIQHYTGKRNSAVGVESRLGQLGRVAFALAARDAAKRRRERARVQLKVALATDPVDQEAAARLRTLAEAETLPIDRGPLELACQRGAALADQWRRRAETAVKRAHAVWADARQAIAEEWVE